MLALITVGPKLVAACANGVAWLAESRRTIVVTGRLVAWGELMGLWPRIGLTALAMAGAWVITWLVLVIIGDQAMPTG